MVALRAAARLLRKGMPTTPPCLPPLGAAGVPDEWHCRAPTQTFVVVGMPSVGNVQVSLPASCAVVDLKDAVAAALGRTAGLQLERDQFDIIELKRIKFRLESNLELVAIRVLLATRTGERRCILTRQKEKKPPCACRAHAVANLLVREGCRTG